MYNCEICGKTSQPNEKCNITAVQTRAKQYENGTQGYETVREKKICNECVKG
jgi:hypothetical protein